MFHHKLAEPEESDTAEEILWNNLRESDKTYNLQLFIGSSMGWLALYPDKNYQDFETELRERGLNTHMIAKRVDLPEGQCLTFRGKNAGNYLVLRVYIFLSSGEVCIRGVVGVCREL